MDAGGQVFDLEPQLRVHQASDLAIESPLHVSVAEDHVQVEASEVTFVVLAEVANQLLLGFSFAATNDAEVESLALDGHVGK